MNHHPVLLKSSLLLALVAGLTAGACEKPGGDDEYRKDCSTVGYKMSSCEGFAGDENDTYKVDCVARGKKVAKADETCGDLWAEALSCVAALPCEEFLMWMYSYATMEPEKEFPCKDEENAFAAECGDLPLWVDE